MVIAETIGAIGTTIVFLLVILLAIIAIIVVCIVWSAIVAVFAYPLAWAIRKFRPGWENRHSKLTWVVPLLFAAFFFACTFVADGRNGVDAPMAYPDAIPVLIAGMAFCALFAFAFPVSFDILERKDAEREFMSSIPKAWRV